MSAAVHAPLINTSGFMLKEKTAEPLVSAFTAVNGRTTPPTPRKLSAVNGMTADIIHVRPLSRQSPVQTQEQKAPLPGRDEWASVRTVAENGHHNSHHSVSPSISDQDRSPTSPGKRKRSTSAEDGRSYPSPDGSTVSRRRLDSYTSVGRDDSPNTVAQVQQLNMEHSQQRTLPPMDRVESERAWAASHDGPHNGYHDAQRHDPRAMDHPQESMNPNSAHSQMSAMDPGNGLERSSTTEITRAGVQVDPKKRKRQFANRTKTGCGTCRRRKKKCDEAKPECNNCQRGGFICEGYANKIPWPKNGVQKPHPPLQAKDRFSVDPAQLYHSHGTSRESYTDANAQNGADGVRNRPIVVEEHDRQPPRNGWSNGAWSEPPRASYPQEQQHPPPEYSQPPPPSSHGRPPSSEQHMPPSTQAPLPPRQHNPRIYHHTPQTMSQVVNTSPVVTAEAALHHQSQQPHQPPMAPPSAGPPTTHYAPPPPKMHRSEKEKMLKHEPFQPFCQQLIHERERCKAAVYRFNNETNPVVDIARDERNRLFHAILAARWTHPPRGSDPIVSGHLGREVFVDTPFMCDYGYNISIGDNVDIGTYCKFLDSGRITIGRNTSIGPNVTIDTQRTPTDPKAPKGSRRTAVAGEVHIADNVHIGANCTILAGVQIGTGAIVHPGSVVVRDIPAHCVARGNPADYV